jgi:hypothetical protein
VLGEMMRMLENPSKRKGSASHSKPIPLLYGVFPRHFSASWTQSMLSATVGGDSSPFFRSRRMHFSRKVYASRGATGATSTKQALTAYFTTAPDNQKAHKFSQRVLVLEPSILHFFSLLHLSHQVLRSSTRKFACPLWKPIIRGLLFTGNDDATCLRISSQMTKFCYNYFGFD